MSTFKKRYIWLISILVFSFILVIPFNSRADSSKLNIPIEQATSEADKLNSIGLFAGGSNGYELQRAPTRIEGLVMLIRLMGEEKEALACTYISPFKDVPKWAEKYAAWAYNKKYTSGTSATTFSPNEKMNTAQYLTFMMRALGYGEGVTLENVAVIARAVRLIPLNEYLDQGATFLRADMVHVSYLALQTVNNNTGHYMYIDLIEKKAIDEEKALAIFMPELSEINKETKSDSTINEVNDPTYKPTKYYSITTTNNNVTSNKLKINGDTLTIDVLDMNTEHNGLYIYLYEIDPKTLSDGFRSSSKVVSQLMRFDDATRSSSYNYSMQSLGQGNYYLLEINSQFSAIIKKDSSAWYFDTPRFEANNMTKLNVADSCSPTKWIDFRVKGDKDVTRIIRELMLGKKAPAGIDETLYNFLFQVPDAKLQPISDKYKKKLIETFGEPRGTDYETAWKIYSWVAQNISYEINANNQGETVLDTKIGDCDGYSNLMIDALVTYGIPARMPVGDAGYSSRFYNKFTKELDCMFGPHAWVEFYDKEKGQWIICDPTWGENDLDSWFDVSRYVIDDMRKVNSYK